MPLDEAPTPDEDEILEALTLQGRLADLFGNIAGLMAKRCTSVQVLLDDHLQPRKDRIANDIHLFLELPNGEYFHLKAYTKHMLEVRTQAPAGKVFLTGYQQPSVDIGGRNHSLRQEWYDWDPEKIAAEIVSQNPQLFK